MKIFVKYLSLLITFIFFSCTSISTEPSALSESETLIFYVQQGTSYNDTVFAMNLKGENKEYIFSRSGRIGGLKISNVGRSLYFFYSNTISHDKSLFRVNLSTKLAEVLVPNFVYTYDESHSGRYVVYSTHDPQGIYLYNIDNRFDPIQPLTNQATTHLKFSPDDQYLAYSDIGFFYVMDLNDYEVRSILNLNSADSTRDWLFGDHYYNYDGSRFVLRIYYVDLFSPFDSRNATMNMDGSDLLIDKYKYVYAPTPSPVSDDICYSRFEGVFKTSPGFQIHSKLIDLDSEIYQLKYSPDGENLIYSYKKDIFIYNFSNETLLNLTNSVTAETIIDVGDVYF